MSLSAVKTKFSTDVLIVGAGPAGLVTAAACIAGGLNVVVLDYKGNVGGWSNIVTPEEIVGPPETVTLSDAMLMFSLPHNPTAKDVNSYLAAFAARQGILTEDRVYLHCRLSHLSRANGGSNTLWKADFEDLNVGERCRGFARTVVLCTGHGLINGCDSMGIWEEAHRPAHTRVLHARQASPIDVAGAIAAGSTVAVVGDGTAAHDCAAALALLLDGKGLTLVEKPVEGAPAFVLDGTSLLEESRRRALHAALQPHPSLPPPGAVDRVLRAPTKRRFWAYVKGRAAAAAVSLSGAGGTRRLSAPGTATIGGKADATAGAVIATAATTTNCPASLGLPPELMKCRLVLWAPSFRDPRVMPFLEPDLRRALLLQGGTQQSSDHLVLYRGVVHPDVPGLAFVGWKAHSATPLLVLELQAQWLVALLTARLQLPPIADMYDDMARQRAWRAAALASPLMSARGSLARTHDGHYIRQLLTDLTGIVELRPRSSLPLSAPTLFQQPLQYDVSRADVLWSEQVVIPLAHCRQPSGATASSVYGTDAGSSYNGTVAADGGSHDEPLGSLPPTSGPHVTAIGAAGCRMPGQMAPPQMVPERNRSSAPERVSGRFIEYDPGSGDGIIDAGCFSPACGGMSTYLGRLAQSPHANRRETGSSVTTAPELHLSMGAAAGRSAPDQISASHCQDLSLLPYRQGVSDTGCHGGIGGGGIVEGVLPICGTGSTQNDSAAIKLPGKARTASQTNPSRHFLGLNEYPLPADDAAPTCSQARAMGLGSEVLVAVAAAVADGAGPQRPGEGEGLPTPQSDFNVSGGGNAAVVAAHRRHKTASVPVLKLLPLARFAPATSSGGEGAPAAVAATAQAAATVDQVRSRRQSQRHGGGASTHLVKRSAPRRSLSYNDVMSIQRDRALQLQECRRNAAAAAAADADATPVAGTPHTLEEQLVALQSHLLDPSAVPFPRGVNSGWLASVHVAAGSPPTGISGVMGLQRSPRTRQSAPGSSGLSNTPGSVAASLVGGMNPISPLLRLSRCSVVEDEAAEDGSKRLMTIEERHLPDSGCESAEHQRMDSVSAFKEAPRMREWHEEAVVPKLPDGGNSISGGSVVKLHTLAPAASGSGSTARRRLPPRRSQTTSCLAALPNAAVDVIGQDLEGPAVSMAAGEASTTLKSIRTAKVAILGNLARISSPRSVGSGSPGYGTSGIRFSPGSSPSGGRSPATGVADSAAGPSALVSRFSRPAFTNDQVPMTAASLASPGSGTGSRGSGASVPHFASLKAKLIAAADRRHGGGAACVRAGAAGADKAGQKGSSPHNIPSVPKSSHAVNVGASGSGLSKSLGGLLGDAAEAARLPYSKRINEAVPSATQYDPFLRPRRAMATDTATAAMATFKASSPSSPLDRSYGSLLYGGSGIPERKSPTAATATTAAAQDVMPPSTSTSSPLPKWPYDFDAACTRKHGASGGIFTTTAAAGCTALLQSPPLPSLPSLAPVKDDDMDTREEREGDLFDMDIVLTLRASIGCPQEPAAADAGADQACGDGIVAAATDEHTGPDALAGILLSAVPPVADSQTRIKESVSSVDRRLIERVQALAAASSGGGGGGSGGDDVQATGVNVQKKLTGAMAAGGGGFTEAGVPAKSDDGSVGAVVASDGRRGPAWVIRRASQARQDQIVGEISSWLREALVRKAVAERPDAAAAVIEEGDDGGNAAAEDGEAAAAGHLTAPAAAGAVVGHSQSRVQNASGWGPGDDVRTPVFPSAAEMPMTEVGVGAVTTTAEAMSRNRELAKSQTPLCLRPSGLQEAPPPPIPRSPVLAPSPPSPARVTASAAAPAPATTSRPTTKQLPKKAASLSAGELRERMRAAAADAISYLKRPVAPRGAAAVAMPE